MNVWFPAYATNLSEKWIYMATWQLNFQKKSPIGAQQVGKKMYEKKFMKIYRYSVKLSNEPTETKIFCSSQIHILLKWVVTRMNRFREGSI